METHYLYLLVDLFCFAATFIFSFHPGIKFYQSWKAFALANFISAAVFIGWDMLYTHWGIWWFNERYTLPYRIGGLPIEELLFFIAIPYSCVFTYHVIKRHISLNNTEIYKAITILLINLLLVTGLVFINRLYTSVTFIGLALMLIYLHFIKKASWLPYFYLSFAFILIPFFISNGILTGALTEQAVVNYNNQHNLSIRMVTIPVEDTFYGMLLILLTITFFEYFEVKLKSQVKSQNQGMNALRVSTDKVS